jgi:hypothetical protein
MAGFLGVNPRDLLPEGEAPAPTEASINRLSVALERLADILSHRSSQDAELLAELRDFIGLRESLGKLGRDP